MLWYAFKMICYEMLLSKYKLCMPFMRNWNERLNGIVYYGILWNLDKKHITYRRVPTILKLIIIELPLYICNVKK